MEDNKIRPEPNNKILPGPGIYMSADQGGGLSIGNTGGGGIWAHMLVMDQAGEYLVPLAQDTQGPYYLDHWPACVAFCHGKVGPINRFLRSGGGLERWLPVPRLQARPVIYAMIDTIAKSPSTRNTKADPKTPYDICNMGASVIDQAKFCKTLKGLLDDQAIAGPLLESAWEGRNLLEHALHVRLFDVADVLWDAGLRFGQGNMEAGLLFKDMVHPSVAQDLGIGLYCVDKNMTTPRPESNADPRRDAGQVYCTMVEKWINRFAQYGGSWPMETHHFSYRTGDTPYALEGNIVCVGLSLTPDGFTVGGQRPDSWPDWIRQQWRQMWEDAALKYAPFEMIDGSVKSTTGSFTTQAPLGAWLREQGFDRLASHMEQKSLESRTSVGGVEPAKRSARF